jgi:toxin secretion/phage lysis holin
MKKSEVNDMLKNIWSWTQTGFAGVGALLGWFLGGLDGFLYALIAFVVVDYITGVLRAVSEKKLSSKIGAHGITKKVAIFLLVGIAHLADVYLLGVGTALRTAVVFFYISNEGISLTENIVALGLPVPDQLKNVLAQLHGKSTEATPTEPIEADPTPIPKPPESIDNPIEQPPIDPGTPQKSEEDNHNES